VLGDSREFPFIEGFIKWNTLLKEHYGLSARKREICRLCALGYSNEEIAKSLRIGIGTVKSHINNIFYRMRIHSRTHIALILIEKSFEIVYEGG